MAAEWRGLRPLRAASKVVAAFAFLVYGIGLGALDFGAPGYALVLGLGLSVVGDVCLISARAHIFKLGILAFLLAHIAYMGLFLGLGVAWGWTAMGGVAVGLLALAVGRFLRPFVRQMKAAVYAYIVVISVMVALAIGMGGASDALVHSGLMVSALAFFLSDLCVARERFVYSDRINKLIGLPLYFGAQLGFAWFGVQALSL